MRYVMNFVQGTH